MHRAGACMEIGGTRPHRDALGIECYHLALQFESPFGRFKSRLCAAGTQQRR